MKKLINGFEEKYVVFLVYAFLGWIYEVVWIFIISGKLENRGFLFGPFLPVYGFGMLLLVVLLRKFMKKKHYLSSMYGLPTFLFFINFIYIIIIEFSQPKIYNVIEFLSKFGLLELFVSVIGVVIYYLFMKNKKININPFIVFVLIFIIATVVEYVSHFALDKMSGIMLWDYSHDFVTCSHHLFH